VLERAVVLADGPAVMLDDLPLELRQPGRRRLRPRLPATVASGTVISSASARARAPAALHRPSLPSHTFADSAWDGSDSQRSTGDEWNSEFVAYERQRLIDALSEAKGNKSEAARLLGMPRSTFFSKVKKHGIL
jgi:transcriptional regulator of acetoin/glycerol metabolism